MITDKVLNAQIARLMRLPFAPADEEDAKALAIEYRRVLRSSVQSDEHLRAVADFLIDRCEKVPPPAQVSNAAIEVSDPGSQKAPLGCDVCRGSGWKSFSRTAHTPAGSYMADYADFCDCDRGVWMREIERQRKAEGESRKVKYR